MVFEPSVLHGLANDASSGADVESDSVTADAHATVFGALDNLVDDVLWLGEVYDAGPFVVALGCEACVPLLDISLGRQGIVELVYDVAAFLGLSLSDVGRTLAFGEGWRLLGFFDLLVVCICGQVFELIGDLIYLWFEIRFLIGLLDYEVEVFNLIYFLFSVCVRAILFTETSGLTDELELALGKERVQLLSEAFLGAFDPVFLLEVDDEMATYLE